MCLYRSKDCTASSSSDYALLRGGNAWSTDCVMIPGRQTINSFAVARISDLPCTEYSPERMDMVAAVTFMSVSSSRPSTVACSPFPLPLSLVPPLGIEASDS
jgi:hypothetical protein